MKKLRILQILNIWRLVPAYICVCAAPKNLKLLVIDELNHWKKCDQQVYQAILDQADKIRYISEYYYRGCMHKRNKLLVDSSCYCVCYLTKEKGGTAFTVNYARKKGLNIINLADRLT